jgi:hypothetical protein
VIATPAWWRLSRPVLCEAPTPKAQAFEAGTMSISIRCPTCGNQALASDDYVGKKVVCPKCKATITVKAPVDPSTNVLEVIPVAAPVSPTPPAGPVAGQQWDLELVPQNTQYKTCDYCGESILAAARKCKHCGEMLDSFPAVRAAEEAQPDWAGAPAGRGSADAVKPPRPFPHLIHAVITVVLCGAWLPVWILHYALSGREGGRAIAWLVGIPLCIAILVFGGFLTIGVVGSVMWAHLSPNKEAAEGKDSRKLASADGPGDERQKEPKRIPDTEPKSKHETEKAKDQDDAERRPKPDEPDEADKKRAEEQEAERKKNDPEEIHKKEAAEAARKKEAEEEAARKAKKKVEDDEAEAARLLNSAKKTLKEAKELKNKKTAEEQAQGDRLLGGVLKRLEGIVENYPKTKAAEEAKKMIADFEP